MGPTHGRLGPHHPHLSHQQTGRPRSRLLHEVPCSLAAGRPLPLQAPASSSLGKNGRRLSDARPRDRAGWARTSSSPCFLRPPAATALDRGSWQLDMVWAALSTHLLSPGRWLPKHWVPRAADRVLPRPLPWPVSCPLLPAATWFSG